jgi:hypothetical protein
LLWAFSAELRLPVLFVELPLKIAKILFKGLGEPEKIICGLRLWFACSLKSIGLDGRPLIKFYGRVQYETAIKTSPII